MEFHMLFVIEIKTKALCIGDIRRFWLSSLGHLVFLPQKNYLDFQSLDSWVDTFGVDCMVVGITSILYVGGYHHYNCGEVYC